MRDREAVCFIADPLDEEHPWRVLLLHNRAGAAGCEDLLALFRQRESRNVRKPRRLHDLQRGAELPFSAIDEDQVRPGGARAIADGVSFLTPLRRLQPLEPPA